MVERGFEIPFSSEPPDTFIKNNKSALQHQSFVFKAIEELVMSGVVVECTQNPTVVNPLTVAVNHKGKERLVLDLRAVNNHVSLEKI